jgi:hypothetical protein
MKGHIIKELPPFSFPFRLSVDFIFVFCFWGNYFFYCFIIHMCIQGLGHFSPQPPSPPLPPTLPIPSSPPHPGETIELFLHLNPMQKIEPILAGVAFSLLLLGLSGSAESRTQHWQLLLY